MMPGENNPWCARELRTPSHSLAEWLPMGNVGVPECTIGVLKDGAWVVDTADGLADLRETRALTFLLPLLNSTFETVREMLANFQKGSKLDCVKPNEFPLNSLIVHAVSSGGYWAEQAFRWLSKVELSANEKIAIINNLTAIENNKVFNQTLRHEARRHRRQMELGQ